VSWPTVPAAELMLKRGGSVNPANYPDETFELLSIPAFDKGEPEIVEGKAIGSSKSCVQPNDVLLSKIVPHIKRCWVVPAPQGTYRQIGSGEWIIFRSDKIYPPFLRHFLTSEIFHKQFMNTTAGVGGSLVRARPAEVGNIEIPLPPLPEQKRIAAILDKADAIRRKRQQAIQLADDFLRAVFLDMFGDPRDGLKIEDMLSQKYLLLHKDGNHGSNYPAKEEFGDDGVVFISAKDISDQDGSIDYASVAHLNESKARKLTIGWLKEGDVLLAHNATVGRVGLFSGEVDEALIGTSLTAFRPNQERLSSVYLFAALKYSGFQAQLKQNMGQSTRNQVPITAQRALKIPVGDLKRQRQFERVFIKLKQVKSNLYAGLKGSDEMFSSLSQRAFSGQL